MSDTSHQHHEEDGDIKEKSEAVQETVKSDDSVVSENNSLIISEEGFTSWWIGQARLKENIKRVCDKYGTFLEKEVPLKEFMYDPGSNLLFCRNAKVCPKP